MVKPASETVGLTSEFDAPQVLKAMRKAAGLSQERFAELVGVARQQLSAYENGHHSPGLDKLAEMAEKAGLKLVVQIKRA